MTKRKINQQQSARIKQRQQRYCHRQIDAETLKDGLVILRHARHALVEDATGQRMPCAIRPAIESLVAGDRVVWQAQGEAQGVVVSCYPRQSLLTRWSARSEQKPVAANVTQLLIVMAPKPELSWFFLDRYLIWAEHLHLSPIIVLSKTDLGCDDLKAHLLKVYAPLGYPILFTRQDEALSQAFLKTLADQVSVFVGPSGVGKSSLIARLLPDRAQDITTQALSKLSELGCHTTRNSQYYSLPQGAVIDSPGVREMALAPLSAWEIAAGFREFMPYRTQCRYRDCHHQETPGCAVKEAVRLGVIDPLRYENYVRMVQEDFT